MPNKDQAKAAESVSVEISDEPSIEHFLEPMRKEAKATKKEQKKVLSAWTDGKSSGKQVLVVKPDGSYKVKGDK